MPGRLQPRQYRHAGGMAASTADAIRTAGTTKDMISRPLADVQNTTLCTRSCRRLQVTAAGHNGGYARGGYSQGVVTESVGCIGVQAT
jgi:hypothetical protein